MNGPYKISEINNIITKKSSGAYILSRNGENAHYVGRSDNDLLSRLKISAERNNYKFFWYEYTESPMKAYYLECEWFHKYLPVDNEIHPAVPPNTNWKCPVKGCPWS